MESAMSPSFGAVTGAQLSLADPGVGRADMSVFRGLLALGSRLADAGDAAATSTEWLQARSALYCEHLAVAAALAVGARCVYGDRPKHVTYARLLRTCSLVDLDTAWGARTAGNYATLLGSAPEGAAHSGGRVERVLMREREAVLCRSVDEAARGNTGGAGSVVALVGDAHLRGMRELLEDGSWEALAGAATDAADTPAVLRFAAEWLPELQRLACAGDGAGVARTLGAAMRGEPTVADLLERALPHTDDTWLREHPERALQAAASIARSPLDGMPPEAAPLEDAYGVQRALAEAVMRQRAPAAVAADMAAALPPLRSAAAQHAERGVAEVYGTCRMMLASLDRELLGRVASGYGCSLWDELQPLRVLRPVNGGPGWSLEAVLALRELNFELD